MAREHDNNSPAAVAASTHKRKAVVKWIIFAVVVIDVATLAFFARNIKDRFFAPKFRVIIAGRMYASGQINRHLLPDILARYHINQIVSVVGNDPADPDSVAEMELARQLHIERSAYQLCGDGTGDIHNYALALADMARGQQAGKVALVHCVSGEQRSNAATFFYRVLIEHRTPRDAMDEIVRNGIRPDSNNKLIPYLRDNLPELARQLAAMGVIERVPDPMPQVP